MRKRRVLALLLALSLVVSGNGMTVLAAEQGTDVSVLAAEEMTDETPAETEEDEDDTLGGADETQETEDKEDKSEEKEPETEGDGSSEEGKTDEGETQENPENPNEKDPSAPKEDDAEQGNDQPADENGDQSGDEGGDQSSVEDGEQGEEQEPAVDAEEPSVSENDLDETETPEKEIEEKPGEVRMMSFTDASGLQITFDAVAAEANAEKATITEDGVLTGIDDSVEGVVDLREKTEITSVGTNAFKSKTKITYIMLPKNVKSFGVGAFEDCTGLKGISIPSRLTVIEANAFKGCISLTQMALPNSVTSIGASAFQGDSRLFMLHMRSVEYSQLESIGDSAFEGCSALEFFCSDDDYDLPGSLTSIGKRAFYGCIRIDEVDMEDGVSLLGEEAYRGCTGIKEVAISGGLADIPEYAFAGCTALRELEFEFNPADPKDITIGAYAFENCIKLTSVDFPQHVIAIRAYAFKGCTALLRIEVGYNRAELEDGAFPDENPGLCIVGWDYSSNAYKYVADKGIRFIAINDVESVEYYTYALKLTGPRGTDEDPITLIVTSETGNWTKDINDITNPNGVGSYNKGVKAGTKCRVLISWGSKQQWKQSIRLVPNSLTCNGEEIKPNNKDQYYFTMPHGGVTIAAEFENISKDDDIIGDKDSIEGRLSFDVEYNYENKIAYMKVGQSAKFYLTNNYGGRSERIPASKITYGIAENSSKDVVSVDSEGTIKALKKGTTIVRAKVKVKDANPVPVDVTVKVEETGIDHISVLLKDSDSNLAVEREGEGKGIRTISIQNSVVKKDYEIDVEASAFATEEDDEEMAVAFTWASSDISVAKVKKASTTASSSENEIIIPKGADGEATITVAAKGKDNKKVTRKFVVSVQNYAPRLDATKITVNPNQTESTATIGIIDAYGKAIADQKVLVAYEDKNNGLDIPELKFERIGEKVGVVTTYRITADGMKEGTYKIKLEVRAGSIISPFELPLTVVVKKSFPKPTVSFDKKAPKINLFLANDGTEIKPVIGKLGEDDEIADCWLEPLTTSEHANYGYDKKFTDNFKIEKKDADWIISQNCKNLGTNKSGKPVLTGYLVMRFKGYAETQTQRYKITIPSQTVAPSYVLDRTADTFGTQFEGDQTVKLQLLDKKTKKPILWDEGFNEQESIVDRVKSTFNGAAASLEPVKQDGQSYVGIKVTIPDNPGNKTGKLVMKVRNNKWAEGKEFSFTYNIKIDNKAHVLSLKKSTITLNANCPEKEESFTLVSNHSDVVITDTQEFKAQSNTRNAQEYEKLSVSCENGEGKVFLKDGGADIKAGNYKYVYTYQNTDGKDKAVTLTVKVNRTVPTVSLKGTNAFNLTAKDGDSYVETSEMTMTVKNLPDNQKYVAVKQPTVPEAPKQPDSGEGSGDGQTQPDNGEGDESSQSKYLTEMEALEETEPDKIVNEEFYRLDTEKTFGSLEITTKKYKDLDVNSCFDFQWEEEENGASGKLKIKLKKAVDVQTYALKMTPIFSNKKDGKVNEIAARPVSFKIQVYNKPINSVKLSAKGKMNLLDRRSEDTSPEDFVYTEKNGIRYTPTVANLKDTLQKVVLFDDYVSSYDNDWQDESKHSQLFEAHITEDGKSFYIVPKNGAKLENKKKYKVYAWLLMDNYKFRAAHGYGIYTDAFNISTAEILPKVKTSKSAADLYLSSKNYEAVFKVQLADEKAVGTIENIAFGEKDEKAKESFEVCGVSQKDGSLEVHLKLKNAVDYKCNSTNKIKMYIQFTGQGTNTAGTPITMNVKINK